VDPDFTRTDWSLHFVRPCGGCGCKCGPVWSSPHPEKGVRSPQCWWYLIAAGRLARAAGQSEAGVEVDSEGTESRMVGDGD